MSKIAPMPTAKRHRIDFKSAMASHVSANMGSENISDPPQSPQNPIPESTTEIPQPVTQDAPTSDNVPSSEPPTMGTLESLQTGMRMASLVKPQDITIPSVHPVSNAFIRDPPLVSQSGAVSDPLEAGTRLGVARRVLSTWLQKKSPFTTRH
ncbi:hypothetical protein BDZ94DRAFT_722953 [Collybia nuda]|uniref:Uncharacterized protein n=1 Tax=Collybia nuda TaxID=64659 RepID=A0A9P6CE39_9AGAR|nr:hypothetical protein BDZ94DRAFT_722953 [Collybia nuda]